MKRHVFAVASAAVLVTLTPAAASALLAPSAYRSRIPGASAARRVTITRAAATARAAVPTDVATPEHDPMRRVRLGVAQNWAGYIAHGGPFSSASTTWTEPSISCGSGESAVASFAGLDGATSPTVEQIGTFAECQGGSAAHLAFFEMYPRAPVLISKPVSAGDTLTATVTASSATSFTLSLVDHTASWSFSTHQKARRAARASAEAITEAPTLVGKGIVTLANFGTLRYSATTVDGQAIGNFNPEAVTMVTSAGATDAQPSALSGGTAFDVTWVPG